jgi:hypothetical protein
MSITLYLNIHLNNYAKHGRMGTNEIMPNRRYWICKNINLFCHVSHGHKGVWGVYVFLARR